MLFVLHLAQVWYVYRADDCSPCSVLLVGQCRKFPVPVPGFQTLFHLKKCWVYVWTQKTYNNIRLK